MALTSGDIITGALMDNFEWRAGFFMRYGLIHTDYKTFRTQWKKCGIFTGTYKRTYAAVIGRKRDK